MGQYLVTTLSSDHDRRDQIKNKTFFDKNRSIESESNFNLQNDFLGAKLLNGAKGLKDFYPLEARDVSRIQSRSGREFDTNFVNQLLLKLADRHPNHSFPNKQAFLAYMGKALSYEMHDAVKVSNGTFKFKDVASDYDQKELYLNQVESSTDINPESRLRRKIAGVFDTDEAYELLTKCRFGVRDHSKFAVCYTRKGQELSRHKQKMLLALGKSVYGDQIEEIVIEQNNEQGLDSAIRNRAQKQESEQVGGKEVAVPLTPSKPVHAIWQYIEEKIVNKYGRAAYNNWFSKVIPDINETTKELVLRAPSEFFKDWIDRNYRDFIIGTSLPQNFRFGGVFT